MSRREGESTPHSLYVTLRRIDPPRPVESLFICDRSPTKFGGQDRGVATVADKQRLYGMIVSPG